MVVITIFADVCKVKHMQGCKTYLVGWLKGYSLTLVILPTPMIIFLSYYSFLLYFSLFPSPFFPVISPNFLESIACIKLSYTMNYIYYIVTVILYGYYLLLHKSFQVITHKWKCYRQYSQTPYSTKNPVIIRGTIILTSATKGHSLLSCLFSHFT